MRTINDVIREMEKMIGLRENPPGSNRISIWDDVGYPSFQGQPYCVATAQLALRRAGFGKDYAPDIFSSTQLLNWAKNNGTYVSPKEISRGCLVVFDWDGSNNTTDRHTAIAEQVGTGFIDTIDGNVSDGVKRCRRTKSQIYGGYRPPYEELEDEMTQEKFEEMYKAMLAKQTGDAHSDWADGAVAKGKKKGIFKGDGAGNYQWKNPISREEFAVVLERLGQI